MSADRLLGTNSPLPLSSHNDGIGRLAAVLGHRVDACRGATRPAVVAAALAYQHGQARDDMAVVVVSKPPANHS
jgi:hypothetical protein